MSSMQTSGKLVPVLPVGDGPPAYEDNPFKTAAVDSDVMPVPLPAGWISQYDEDSKEWYFVNENVDPPFVTWDDPRKEEMDALKSQLRDPNLGTATSIAAKEAEERARAEAAARAEAEAAAAAQKAQEALDAARVAEEHRRLAEQAQRAADAQAAAEREAKLQASKEAAAREAQEAARAAAEAARRAQQAQQAQAQAEETARRNKAAADAAARAAELERQAAEARRQAERVQDAALDPSKPSPITQSTSSNIGPGGVPFPHDGWLAQLDPRSGRYYFVDRSKNPPLITWDDPRTPQIETAPVMPQQAPPPPVSAPAPAPPRPTQRPAVCARNHQMVFKGIGSYYSCDNCHLRRDRVGELHARCDACNQDFCPNCTPVPASAFYQTTQQTIVIAPPPPAPPVQIYQKPVQPPPPKDDGVDGMSLAMGALAGAALMGLMGSGSRHPPPPHRGPSYNRPSYNRPPTYHGGGGHVNRGGPGVFANPNPPRW